MSVLTLAAIEHIYKEIGACKNEKNIILLDIMTSMIYIYQSIFIIFI